VRPLDDPWALVLVVHRPRAPAPALDGVAQGAVSATLELIERSHEREPWGERVQHWSPRPRKVVLRARGSRWQQVARQDGVTSATAIEVRALVPARRSERPALLDRLQALTEPLELAEHADEAPVTLLLAPGLELSSGKWAAQCAHAAQFLRERLAEPVRGAWRRTGFAVTVRPADREGWDAAVGLPHAAVVRDAGLTEVAPGTATVCALPTDSARRAGAP
jgi:peptidyl-tRNA hydrolase